MMDGPPQVRGAVCMSTLRLILLAWGLTLLAALGACGSKPAPPPDVVFIVVDTLRADHMSLHGYPRRTTPNLDALGGEGLVFDHAIAGSSWTLPSMAMLMTGAYDGRNGGTLDRPWPTLAEGLAGAGYHTAAVVANPILGGERGAFDVGFERGFEAFEVVKKRYGLEPGERRQTNGWYGDEVVRRGIAQLQAADGPTFLWLHLYDPHFPRVPRSAEVLADASDRAAVAAWRAERLGALTPEEDAYAQRELDAYDAEVWGADAAIGDLVRWLKAEGRYGNTVFVVTADHGEGLWNRPLPAGEEPKVKNEAPRFYMDHGIMLHDEQVRVPLLFAGPGVPQGVREASSVSLVDVAPTVRALAGGAWEAAPAGVGGRALIADGRVVPASGEVFSFCSRSTSITLDDRWRLHWPSEARASQHGDRPQLFDLASDPLERRPLGAGTAEAPDPAALGAYLERFHAAATPAEDLSPEAAAARRDFLDALGYVDQ